MRSGKFAFNHVERLRKERLLTQSELADKAQVGRRTLCSVEELLGCTPKTKKKLAAALGVQVEEAFPLEQPKCPSCGEVIYETRF